MIVKEIALSLRRGDRLTHNHLLAYNGQPVQVRVNGTAKVWKRASSAHPAGDFELPVKCGLWQYFKITPTNAHEWRTVGQAREVESYYKE